MKKRLTLAARALGAVLMIAALLVPAAAPTRAQDAAPGGRLVLLSKLDGPPLPDGLDILEQYGEAFVLARLSEGQLAALPEANVYDRMADRTVISLNGTTWDTQQGEPAIAGSLRSAPDDPYFLVQFYAPIKKEWKADLEAMGVTFLGYHPTYTYIVRMDPALVDRVRAAHAVQWVGAYHPAYRLATEAEMAIAAVDNGRVAVEVRGFPDGNTAALQADLEKAGASIWLAEQVGPPVIRVWAAPDLLPRLAALPGVYRVEPFDLPRETNDKAVQSSHAWDVWKAGRSGLLQDLMGAGQIAGSVDSGLDNKTTSPTIEDFYDYTGGTATSRVVYNQNSAGCGGNCNASDTSGHGTHTSGTIVGNGYNSLAQRGLTAYATAADPSFDYAWGAGMAPEAKIAMVHAGDGSGGIWTTPATDWVTLYNQGARSVNNSWGYATYSYGGNSYTADNVMWTYQDHLIVVSAGNTGPTAGGAIAQPANAKNILSVGASTSHRPSNGWYSETSSALVYFSSRGPVNTSGDTRFKPDIVAPGANVLSTRTNQAAASTDVGWGNEAGIDGGDGDGDNDGSPDYAFNGGTSMSAPMVTGAATVVRDYFQDIQGFANATPPSAALIKAALLNGAVDMGYGYEALTSPSGAWYGGRNLQGWGFLNVEQAIAPRAPRSFFFDDFSNITNTTHASTMGADTTGDYVQYTVGVADSSEPLKVTLTWSDYQSGSSGYAVNNLNLLVTSPSSTSYYGNRFTGSWSVTGGSYDALNNTEAVYLQNPAAGTWTIRVTDAAHGSGTQPFALVVSGGLGANPSWSRTCSGTAGTCANARAGTTGQTYGGTPTSYNPSLKILVPAEEHTPAGGSTAATFRVTNWGRSTSTIGLSYAVTNKTGAAAAGVTVTFNPTGPLSLASGASQDVVATISVGGGVANGAYDVSVIATSAASGRGEEAAQVSLDLLPPAEPGAVDAPAEPAPEHEPPLDKPPDPALECLPLDEAEQQEYADLGAQKAASTLTEDGTARLAELDRRIECSQPPAPQVEPDSGNGGWTHSGTADEWEWGAASYVYTCHNSSSGCWATDLDNTYSNYSDQYLYSVGVTVPSGTGTVYLEWWQAYQTESGYDTAEAAYTCNGGANWSTIFSASGTAGWTMQTQTASCATGSTLQLRYRLTSDVSQVFAGYFIDDVRLYRDSTTFYSENFEPGPNLSTSTKTGPASATVGDVVAYTVSIVNNGASAATGGTLTDPIPTNATYVGGSLSCSAGYTTCTYNSSLNRIEWSGTVAAGATVTVQFSVDTDSVACGSTMQNTATIAATGISPFTRSASTTMLGTITDILTEGFETSVPPSGWTETDVTNTSGDWSRVTTGSNPTASPHGGSAMAMFNGWNAYSGDSTRLWTGSLSFSSVNKPQVTFWMFHDNDYNYAGNIQVQVSTNGTSWTTLATFNRYSAAGDAWSQHTVDLSSVIGQATVYVGFLAVSDYWGNMYLDDVAIQDLCGTNINLSTSTKEAPGSVLGGSTVNYTIRIINTGSAGATGAEMNDAIPAGATYNNDCSASSGTCSYAGGIVSWDGDVGIGATVTIQFSVDTDSVPCGTTLVNTAEIEHPAIGQIQRSASTAVTCPPRDLLVIPLNVVADEAISNQARIVSLLGPQVSADFWASGTTLWAAYLSGESHNNAEAKVWASCSSDGGVTWTNVGQVDGADGAHYYGPVVAGKADGSSVTFVWLRPNVGVYARTWTRTSGCTGTWRAVQTLATYPGGNYRINYPDVIYDTDGTILATWRMNDNATGGTDGIISNQSTTDGVSWAGAAGVPDASGADVAHIQAQLALDTANNDVWMAYQNSANSGDIYVKRWIGSTNLWATTGTYHVAVATTTNVEARPGIGYVAATGSLWVTWHRYASVADPSARLYYTRSTAGTLPNPTWLAAQQYPTGVRTAEEQAAMVVGDASNSYISYEAYSDGFRGSNLYALRVPAAGGAPAETFQLSATSDDPPLYGKGNAGSPKLMWATTTLNGSTVSGPALLYTKNPIDNQSPDYSANLGVAQTLYNLEENFDVYLVQLGITPTAVELKSFKAFPEAPAVHVRWETVQEIDNLGFNLYRSNTRAGLRIKLNAELIPSLVPPGSPFGAVYDYLDTFRLRPGRRYFYWLEAVDLYGNTQTFGPARAVAP